jgi:hypothetical protein
MIFLILLGLYVSIALASTIPLTRNNYDYEFGSESSRWSEGQMQTAAIRGFLQSMIWPAFIVIVLNKNHLSRKNEKAIKAKEDKKRTDALIRQYQLDNAWEKKFKDLQNQLERPEDVKIAKVIANKSFSEKPKELI